MKQNTDEGLRRLEAIRDQMRGAKLDALLIYSHKRGHVAYVSGYRPNYHTNSAFVVLPLEGEPVLLIKFGFDLARAKTISWFNDIRPGHSEDLQGLFLECREVIHEMKLRSARIGLVASDETMDEMSTSLFKEIQEGLSQAQLEPASDLINRLRMEKGPGEIEKLRQSAHIAELASSAMQPAIVPGNEDYLAAARAGLVAKTEGAERCDLFISVDPSHIALPPLHLCFSPGNPVSCELTVEYEGYWVQICRTFFLGQPSTKQNQIFKACCDAYEAALEMCRPGRPVSAVAKAAVDTLERASFAGGLKYGLGHGVGLDIPEPYSVDLHSKATLGNNMILVVHVGVWVPDEGSALVGGPILIGQAGATPLDHPQREMIQL